VRVSTRGQPVPDALGWDLNPLLRVLVVSVQGMRRPENTLNPPEISDALGLRSMIIIPAALIYLGFLDQILFYAKTLSNLFNK